MLLIPLLCCALLWHVIILQEVLGSCLHSCNWVAFSSLCESCLPWVSLEASRVPVILSVPLSWCNAWVGVIRLGLALSHLIATSTSGLFLQMLTGLHRITAGPLLVRLPRYRGKETVRLFLMPAVLLALLGEVHPSAKDSLRLGFLCQAVPPGWVSRRVACSRRWGPEGPCQCRHAR